MSFSCRVGIGHLHLSPEIHIATEPLLTLGAHDGLETLGQSISERVRHGNESDVWSGAERLYRRTGPPPTASHEANPDRVVI